MHAKKSLQTIKVCCCTLPLQGFRGKPTALIGGLVVNKASENRMLRTS